MNYVRLHSLSEGTKHPSYVDICFDASVPSERIRAHLLTSMHIDVLSDLVDDHEKWEKIYNRLRAGESIPIKVTLE